MHDRDGLIVENETMNVIKELSKLNEKSGKLQ